MPNKILPPRKFFLLALAAFCGAGNASDGGASSARGEFFLSADARSTQYSLLGPALSYHNQRTHAKRPYNETHSGLGIEQRALLAHSLYWERRLSVSVMNDSFDQTALFTQFSLLRDMASINGLRLLGGLSTGLAYKHTRWEGPRQWVPLLGAAFSLKQDNGMGLNAIYVYRQNKTTGRVNGIFTVQSSFAF